MPHQLHETISSSRDLLEQARERAVRIGDSACVKALEKCLNDLAALSQKLVDEYPELGNQTEPPPKRGP